MQTLTDTGSLIEELTKNREQSENRAIGRSGKFMPDGELPSQAALKTAASLLLHSDTLAEGVAFGDNNDFLCELPHCKPFSPGAAFGESMNVGAPFVRAR